MYPIDGRQLAARIRAELKVKVAAMATKPGLAIVLVGDDVASHTYVRLKEKAAREIGLHFVRCEFPANTSEAAVLTRIAQLNADPNIHGIIVQLPLPSQLDADRVVNTIAPAKDADGFLKASLEKFRTDAAALPPVLCEGIWRLITNTGQAYTNAKAIVLANSTTFGEPMALLLTRNGLDVQIAYPPFHHSQELTLAADVTVIAIGKPHFLQAKDVKPNATIIDVGYTRVKDKDVGDVDAESMVTNPGWLTPVPGGVGPVTVAMLLERTVRLALG
ncbi:MAG: bifunctional 5,10-methylenetetrahydrofolate dehydrogenase/5,10-methenyltetrahydrofolate cyclohydrolase [bacterium]|nr:bifunctional 5,10-methylenetetrahydrofolate dehydrogenase/5,10-methenyltetrahydrofolate cyclohydrolase [bacterium]